MKNFEVKFRWSGATKIRRWRVRARNDEHAQRCAERILKMASDTARVVSVKEIIPAG